MCTVRRPSNSKAASETSLCQTNIFLNCFRYFVCSFAIDATAARETIRLPLPGTQIKHFAEKKFTKLILCLLHLRWHSASFYLLFFFIESGRRSRCRWTDVCRPKREMGMKWSFFAVPLGSLGICEWVQHHICLNHMRFGTRTHCEHWRLSNASCPK